MNGKGELLQPFTGSDVAPLFCSLIYVRMTSLCYTLYIMCFLFLLHVLLFPLLSVVEAPVYSQQVLSVMRGLEVVSAHTRLLPIWPPRGQTRTRISQC